MQRPRDPLFLERQTYRRRRLEDAACMLPFLGVVLLIFPAMWSETNAAAPPGTATRGLYIFAAWAGLILAAGLLSRRLMRGVPPGDGGAEPPERD